MSNCCTNWRRNVRRCCLGEEQDVDHGRCEPLGRVDHTISPSGLLTSYTYDKRGQQLSVTMTVATHNPDTGAVVNQTITSSSTYDDAGKVLTSTDPLNHTTQTVYDQYARPYKTIFADGSFVEMGYDSRGRKAWEREQRFVNQTGDANLRQTDYEYDDLGRLIAVVQPDLDVTAGVQRPRYEYTIPEGRRNSGRTREETLMQL